jgi:hypothetical protein
LGIARLQSLSVPKSYTSRRARVRLAGGLPYQPWAAELVKKRTADLGKDDSFVWWKPGGALRLLPYLRYRMIIHTQPHYRSR